MVDILLIDDDELVANSVQPVLAREGYRVDCAVPGMKAIRRMLVDEPDLVILGVDPPHDGWRFCHQVLSFVKSPLLLLLSTYDENDQIKGLRLGADACVTKPVPLGELVARVQALLRRRERVFADGDLVVDLEHRVVLLDEKPLALTPTEFRMLSFLVEHVGEVVSRELLLTHVWGPNGRESCNLITAHIYNLRQKIEPDPRHPRRIVTHLREGYALRRIGE